MNRYQLLFLTFLFSTSLVADTTFSKGTFSVDEHVIQMQHAYLLTGKHPVEASGYVLTVSSAAQLR